MHSRNIDPAVYATVARLVQRLSIVSQRRLENMSLERFHEIHSGPSSAIGISYSLQAAFAQLKEGWSYLAFLLAVPILEKTLLTFVLAKYAEKGHDVVALEPSLRKMKDILEFPDLADVIGPEKVCYQIIFATTGISRLITLILYFSCCY